MYGGVGERAGTVLHRMMSFVLEFEEATTYLFAAETSHARVPSVSHCPCFVGAIPGLPLQRERDRTEDAFASDSASDASASASASPSASASDPSDSWPDCELARGLE